MTLIRPVVPVSHIDSKSLETAIFPEDYSRYIDRQFSWVETNQKALEEAWNDLTPLLERLKFASILSSSLDEFFMVGVGGLARALKADVNRSDPGRETIHEQMGLLADSLRALVTEHDRYVTEEIWRSARKGGIFIHSIDEVESAEIDRLNNYFQEQVFPILTPLAVDPGHPFPFLTNLSLNLVIIFEETSWSEIPRAYDFIEIPQALCRLIPINTQSKEYHFLLLEDLVCTYVSELFPRMKIKQIFKFRVTRNYTPDPGTHRSLGALENTKRELKDHSQPKAVRLEVERDMPRSLVKTLIKGLGVEEKFTYDIKGPLNICGWLPLCDLK